MVLVGGGGGAVRVLGGRGAGRGERGGGGAGSGHPRRVSERAVTRISPTVTWPGSAANAATANPRSIIIVKFGI